MTEENLHKWARSYAAGHVIATWDVPEHEWPGVFLPLGLLIAQGRGSEAAGYAGFVAYRESALGAGSSHGAVKSPSGRGVYGSIYGVTLSEMEFIRAARAKAPKPSAKAAAQ